MRLPELTRIWFEDHSRQVCVDLETAACVLPHVITTQQIGRHLTSGSDLTADPAGFEVFYQREFRPVVAIARALVRDGAAAEDLAQEAFLAAHRHWRRIGDYENPRAWLRRVVVNKATSFHRRRGAELRALTRIGPNRVESSMPDLSPETDAIWEAVRRLPQRQAQAVALFYVGQLTVEEIAGVMQCQQGAVKSDLHRARTRLSESLSAWDEETK